MYYTHSLSRTHTHARAHTHVCKYECTYLCHTYTHKKTRTNSHARTHTPSLQHSLCLRVCMSLLPFAHMYTQKDTHELTRTHTNTHRYAHAQTETETETQTPDTQTCTPHKPVPNTHEGTEGLPRPVKPIFLHLGPSTEVSSSGGRTDNSIHRAWQALGIIILTPARDASHRRGAATTRQFAGLGARGVTKSTTGTNTSKLRVPGLPAHAQSTRRHNCCRPDGRNHGHITHQLDPRRTYTAATMESYAPCNHTNTAAST